jgi:hypothetical protein
MKSDNADDAEGIEFKKFKVSSILCAIIHRKYCGRLPIAQYLMLSSLFFSYVTCRHYPVSVKVMYRHSLVYIKVRDILVVGTTPKMFDNLRYYLIPKFTDLNLNRFIIF